MNRRTTSIFMITNYIDDRKNEALPDTTLLAFHSGLYCGRIIGSICHAVYTVAYTYSTSKLVC
jgi:hypothetical protein